MGGGLRAPLRPPGADLSAPTSGRRIVRWLAWASVILSWPVWGAAFVVVPVLPLTLGQKAVAAGLCIGAGEVMFWGAGAVLGAELMARFQPKRLWAALRDRWGRGGAEAGAGLDEGSVAEAELVKVPVNSGGS